MGYIGERKREKKAKKNKGRKFLYGKVCSIDRKGIGIMVFQARGRGKEPFLFMGMGSCGGKFA